MTPYLPEATEETAVVVAVAESSQRVLQMKSTERLRVAAMAPVAAAALGPALMMSIIRLKAAREVLVAAAVAVESTNLVSRLPTAAILLAAAAARVADPLMAPQLPVEVTWEISAAAPAESAPIPMDRASAAAAEVEGAVSEALSSWIAI
jgi:hypothetical protein